MKKLLILAAALTMAFNASAQKNGKAQKAPSVPTEADMGAYVMVYHKDQDHSLHMAISYDSYNWTSLNNDKPIICGDSIAMQHGIRDPHIFRGPDGGFYLAMTDLHIFAHKKYADNPRFSKISEYRDTEWERDGKDYTWGNNRGLVLMKSFDLIHWTRTNIDFTKLTCPTGVTNYHGVPVPWSEVGCVWAPETVYDYETGHLLVHFTTRFKSGNNLIYYVYMNDDFTEMISEPKLLFEAPLDLHGVPKYTVIDSDICKVGDTYHLFYVSHEHTATVKHATSKNITGPYIMDDKYNDGEPQGHEAPNCWKRLGQDKYVIMFDNYHRNPHNFGFVETTDFQTFTPIGYFDAEGSPMKRTNFAEQKHAAVAPLTVKEAQALEKYWKKNATK
ncbi:MAG: glycoside hydrolase family 43 protein [Bacteroidaceae bacterium]|nr:glycoside hydrolase family 43 protein [Bacteroidaceae bacterium]